MSRITYFTVVYSRCHFEGNLRFTVVVRSTELINRLTVALRFADLDTRFLVPALRLTIVLRKFFIFV